MAIENAMKINAMVKAKETSIIFIYYSTKDFAIN